MPEWLLLFLILAGVVPAFFTAYQLFFIGATVILPRAVWRTPIREGNPKSRFCVIIPAYNEELLIGYVVDSIREVNYPKDHIHVIVIADNCNDNTAAIARKHGAECRERHDMSKRGKPYALNWMINQLETERYEGFVIIDADTTVHSDFFRVMDARLLRGEQAIQGYFGVLNPDDTWLTRLAILPGVLKFKFHFPGKMALGLTCTLAGNGMCFSREIINRFGWNAYSITENWEYWVQLILAGYKTTSAADAIIYSQVVRSLKTGTRQRQRWLQGRVDTLRRYVRRLAVAAVRGRVSALDALLEMIRPSYSNLMFVSLLYLILCIGITLWSTEAYGWAIFAGIIMVGQIIYLLSGLLVQRAPLRTWLALSMVPLYLLWKFSLTVMSLFGASEKRWLRTKRHDMRRKP